LYITERGVFQLTGDGAEGALELIEIAPGIDCTDAGPTH
jgi:acyl CoA:acetate/3-ketoacid CoA transferase